MKTKEELLKVIAKCDQKKEKAVQKLKELDAKPVDGWYVCDYDPKWISYVNKGYALFGCDSSGVWHESKEDTKFNFDEPIRLATPEEVTQRLTEFVNGLGYVEGVKCKSKYDGKEYEIGAKLTFENYVSPEYCIWMGGYCCIWSSEKGWAKIVEEPKYKVEVGSKVGENLHLKTWSKQNGAKFYFTIKRSDMNYSDHNNFNSEELAKEIETFLNSKK